MCTAWLTKYTNKNTHSIPLATLFNNHINSSGMPVGTKFTATYVGMIVE